ncbi:MAG: hypothetical protein J6Q15_01620 [Clostridia bacterium]|nr:hypothetical protein [Clostridia bacterium]
MEIKESFFNFNIYEDPDNKTIRFQIRGRENEYRAVRDVIDYLVYNKLNGDYELTCRGNKVLINRQSKVMDILNACIKASAELCR